MHAVLFNQIHWFHFNIRIDREKKTAHRRYPPVRPPDGSSGDPGGKSRFPLGGMMLIVKRLNEMASYKGHGRV